MARLFGGAMGNGAQMIRQYDPDFADFMEEIKDTLIGRVTPVKVLRTEPGDDAVDVPADVVPRVIFDGEADPTTVTNETIHLRNLAGGIDIDGAVGYTATTHEAFFEPVDSLQAGATYRLTVTTGLRAKGGLPLDKDYIFKFTVVA